MSGLILVSHHLCPFVQRAAIALGEKGVAFERVSIDLAAKPDWFRAISPLGKVPLLRVARPGGDDGGDEAVLFESAVICEFIEETQPGPALHPADPIERARHRAWMEFASSVLGDIYAIETTPDAALFEARQRALTEKFARLEKALGPGPFFAGARFSLVDAAFGPAFRYFDVLDSIADLGILADKPKVAAWRRALAARPTVRAAVAADYPERLWRFLDAQDSHLRTMIRSAGAWPLGRPQYR
jgi:glutathione S-transferase